ncbi:MAG: hypothetical protein M1436_10480 [Acidobacteria bacterium]|nr:hypothetical protein [Acidobacteriota bacterium]
MKQSIGQATAHLHQAREMLAKPWTRGTDELQTSLAQAVEDLQSALRAGSEGNRDGMAAGVQQLQGELGGIQRLLESAFRLTSGWSQTAGLFAGVYGRDAETIPVAPAPRVSVQG